MAKRHGGIVTFGVLGIVFGFLGILYNGFFFVVLAGLKAMAPGSELATPEVMEAVSGPVLLSIAVSAVTGLMVFVAGIGVLTLKGWARVAYVIAAAITIVNRLLTFPMHFTQPPMAGTETEPVQQAANQFLAMGSDLSVIAFNVLALWFFHRIAIKTFFQPVAAPSS